MKCERRKMILQRKIIISLAVYLLLISIMIGGCTMMEPKTVSTTNKYPDKPITIIVPFSAGGAYDLVARALEKTAIQHIGQPLIVVNKPGGAGTIGWNELAGANPDGYTIGISGVEIILQSMYGPAKYHYPTALEPLGQIFSSAMVMAIQVDQPWRNVDDVVKYARQHPGELKFGNSGVGSLPHILSEKFAISADIATEQVPFRGASESVAALLGGHIEAVFINPASIKEQLKSGTVRVLATTTEQRLTDPVFASIPTFKEQGLDIVFNNWVGVAAPKELPAEIKTKLANGLKAIIADPEFKNTLENIGLQAEYLDPQEFQMKWIVDNQTLSKTVQETGILDRIKEQKK
jgi:tripartite-type tricarboxylate transporter receptor subunit TctC